MTAGDAKEWLLLIHQIPPKPDALRVKIWRRLQQVGAVAIKQSVYVMPLSEQSREDLSWILKEIVEGGGDGSISEARFIEGLSDEQIATLFQSARKTDYEKLIQDVNALLADWSSGAVDPQVAATKGLAQVSRLRRRLDDLVTIDFYQAPERPTAELLLNKLGNFLSGRTAPSGTGPKSTGELVGKTWVTRSNVFIDRIACGWLIRKFVDPAAPFKFVAGPRYSLRPDEVRFDMFDAEYTHEGDRCTFEVMTQHLALQDPALAAMAEVVHDIDLKDEKFARRETDGFSALMSGLVATHKDDDLRMSEGFRLFEHLYAYFQRQRKGAALSARTKTCKP
jgi:hypothetical protein